MRQTLRKIYLYKIFDYFMLIYALYAVMFVQRGGLDTFQISTLFIIWTATGIVFEVPTGALADKYSRRTVLAVGQVIRGLGFLLWLAWPTYWGFALGFVLWGIGESLDSGTFQALVYDELKADGIERDYARVIGRTEAISQVFWLIATLLSAPVFRWGGYPALLLSSVAATLAAAATAYSLPERRHEESTAEEGYAQIIRQAGVEVARNPLLWRVIAFGILVATLCGVLDEYSNLYVQATGVQTYLIPIVIALMYLPNIAIGFFAGRLEHWRSWSFMLMVVAAGLALFVAGRSMNATGIAGFAIFLLLTKGAEIAYGAKLQHGIQGHTRSTITSINGLGVSVAAIAAYFVYGVATRIGGTSGAIMLFGLGAVAIGLIMLATTHGRLLRNTS
jgi:MFS family permease